MIGKTFILIMLRDCWQTSIRIGFKKVSKEVLHMFEHHGAANLKAHEPKAGSLLYANAA